MDDQEEKKKSWTTELAMLLISAVEEKPILWDVRDSAYKNRDARELAWAEVASKVEVTKAEANDKWRLLRQQFRNALSKAAKNKSGMAAKTKPPNEFFAPMMFMKPILSLQANYRESNLAPFTSLSPTPADPNEIIEVIYEQFVTDVEDGNSSSQQPPLTPTPPGPSVSKRVRKNNDETYRTAVTKAMAIVNETEENTEHIWARYVASVMTNYPKPEAVRRFKFKVNRLVEQLEMGEFDSSLPENQLADEDPLCYEMPNMVGEIISSFNNEC